MWVCIFSIPFFFFHVRGVSFWLVTFLWQDSVANPESLAETCVMNLHCLCLYTSFVVVVTFPEVVGPSSPVQ